MLVSARALMTGSVMMRLSGRRRLPRLRLQRRRGILAKDFWLTKSTSETMPTSLRSWVSLITGSASSLCRDNSPQANSIGMSGVAVTTSRDMM